MALRWTIAFILLCILVSSCKATEDEETLDAEQGGTSMAPNVEEPESRSLNPSQSENKDKETLNAANTTKHNEMDEKEERSLKSAQDGDEREPESRTVGSVTWTTYCGCFQMATTSPDKEQVKRCFKSFFRGNADVKRILKKYKNMREVCFVQSKDTDEECKIVRRFVMSLRFREDIDALVTKMGGHLQATSYKVILYMIWRQQPDIYEVCKSRANPLAIVNVISELSGKSFAELKTGDLKVLNLAKILGDDPLGANLDEQLRELCYRRDPSSSPESQEYIADTKNFCDLDFLKTMVRKMKKFTDEAKVSGKWSDDKLRNFYNGLMLNFVAFQASSPNRYPTSLFEISADFRVNGYKNNINTIVKLVHARDFDQLKMLTKFLPDDILTCSGNQQTTTEACFFKKILDQLVTYFKLSGVTLNGKKRLMLSTSTNYERLLEFRQMNRILTVVQQNQLTTITLAEDITNSNNQRFTELKTYFVQLQRFNNNKARADIGFIDGWITKYRATVSTLVTQNSDRLTDILKALHRGVIADVAEKTARMALAIAEACNPLKTLFGGSTLGDIADATAEWTVAVSNLNIANNLNDQLQTLINKATDMGTRFAGNSNDIKKVMDLVRSSETSDSVEFEKQKRQFIQLYSAYSPRVKRPELAEMDSYWDNVVDTACDVILNLGTATGVLVSAADIKRTGACWKIKVSIAKMTSVYEEIYDYQFDLMETLASSMRAKIGKREAQNIAGNFESFPERENDNTMRYRSIYTLSYLTYNIQTWNTIKLYCDKLQYAEGGVRPGECQAENTDLPSLMSRTKRTCTADNSEDVRIPIKPGSDKRAFLNITNLYKGEHVTFQITNKQWLVDNKWILDSEKDKAIYVKNFELFLPTVSEESVTYISKVVATGENVLKICSDCTQYVLPDVERESKFKEGYEASCEESKRFTNPYTICRSKPLVKLCRVTTRTDDPAGSLYPSIYARYRFKIDGYSDTPIPEPANNDMFLKAKITYCSLNAAAKRSTTAFVRGRRSRKCCTGNNYFSVTANQCTACPADSQPNLNGYYCEKNDDALMVEE